MTQSYISLRFEQIEKRFSEIELLLNLAKDNYEKVDLYQTLCRSAHVLLISHFEGLYKEICKDILDDINSNTNFSQVPKNILQTHCDYFIQNKSEEKSAHLVRKKLIDAFKDFPSNLKIEPFLFVDNKNPTPTIIEIILERFGIVNFFWSLMDSDLDVVFQNLKRETQRLKNKLFKYVRKTTMYYPYTADKSIYNPIKKIDQPKTKTLWEEFLNNLLKQRHNIVHGHIIDNPINHEALGEAKTKIEILIYVYIINLCSVSNPLIFI